jgi:hypothetical protein
MEFRENGRVAYFVFTDPWELSDIAALLEDDNRRRDQSPQTIHSILNLAHARRLPPGAMGLRQISPELNHPRAGLVVLVGSNGFVRAVAEMVFKVAHSKKFKFVATEEEAWTYLRQMIQQERAA